MWGFISELRAIKMIKEQIQWQSQRLIFSQCTYSPCIMCVQYRGGCSVPWGVFSTVGGYLEYRGGIS